MNWMILAFVRRRWAAAVFLIVYFVPMVLLHRKVARLSTVFEARLTSPAYNRVWGLAGLAVLAAVLVFLALRLVRGEDRGFRAAVLAATLAVVGAAHVVILSANLEYIHLLQFLLLVPFVFALTGRFGETVFWTGLLGALDELYQYYVVWWPFQNAYDFNDIILDAVGGLFMAVLLYFWLRPETVREAGHFRRHGGTRSPAAIAAGSLIVLALAANAAGLLAFYPPQAPDGTILKSKAPVLLSMVPREKAFWSKIERKKKDHIVSAAEFVAAMAGLTAFAGLIDRRVRRRTADGRKGATGT